MLRLRCAILEIGEAAIVDVNVERSSSVADLQNALHKKLIDAHHLGPTSSWKLIVAKQSDGTWPDYTAVRGVLAGYLYQCPYDFIPPKTRLDSAECFGLESEPPRGAVHVIVAVPKKPIRLTRAQRFDVFLQSASVRGPLPQSLGAADADTWLDTTDCQSLKRIDELFASMFPDLPKEFYIRKESLMIWRVFKQWCSQPSDGKPPLTLVGSAGVGKSSLLALMCMYLAVNRGDRVVLFQKRPTTGQRARVLLLLGDRGLFYVWDKAQCVSDRTRWSTYDQFCQLADFAASGLASSSLQADRRVWLCADGLFQDELQSMLPSVRLDILALPYGTWAWSSTHTPGQNATTQCLVPLWRECDLKALGTLQRRSDAENELRFECAGGNLRWFLIRRIGDAEATMFTAVDRLAASYEKRSGHIDAASLAAVSLWTVTDVDCVSAYANPKSWTRVVTSPAVKSLLPEASYTVKQ